MKTFLPIISLLAAGTLFANAYDTYIEDEIGDWPKFAADLSAESNYELTITKSFAGTTDSAGYIKIAMENTITSAADADEIYTISNSHTILFVPYDPLTISNITFSNFTNSFSGGNVPDGNANFLNGGVILNSGTLEINAGTTFSNNSSVYGNGGAIANIEVGSEANSNLTISGAMFTGNSVDVWSSYGGAIFNGENATIYNIEKTTFSSNSAHRGGAIYNNGTISSLAGTFSNNSAGKESAFSNENHSGGAIYNGSTGTITTISADFTGNSALGENVTGGAICNLGKIGTISQGMFENNTATSQGGAIYNAGTIDEITGTTFKNNSAGTGDAIFNTASGTIGSISATFENNGTAIYNLGAIMIAAGTTFSNNTYAILNAGTVYLNPGDNKTLTLNEAIDGAAGMQMGTIQVNCYASGTVDDDGIANFETTTGTVILNAKIGGNTVNLQAGRLEIAIDNAIQSGATLNVLDGTVDVGTHTLSNYTLNGGEITGTNFTLDSTGTLVAGTISGENVKISGSGAIVGTLNLKPSENGAIELTGAISGTSGSSNIDINGDATGTVMIDANVSNNRISLYSGTLVLGTNFVAQDNTTLYLYGGTLVGANALDYGLTLNCDTTIENATLSSGFQTSKLTNVGTGTIEVTLKNLTADGLTSSAILSKKSSSLKLSIVDGTFTNNSVTSFSGHGGAVEVDFGATIGTLAGTFTGNSSTQSSGGAIYNEGTIEQLAGTFTENSAGTNGGAIYNASGAKMTIVADAELGNTKFSGNTANGASNAIYNAGTLNLQASNSRTITFDDAISGNDSGTINIENADAGMVVFNATVSGNTVNLLAGTLILGNAGTVDGGVTMSAGTQLVKTSATNGSVSLTATGEIIVNSVDVFDFANGIVTVTSDAGVEMNLLTAWSFDVLTSGNEVLVSMQIATGLAEDDIVIFHLDDVNGSEWTDFSATANATKTYNSTTGTLSFTTTNFCSYGVAVIPEPSMFGFFAGTLALLLAGTRRRRK